MGRVKPTPSKPEAAAEASKQNRRQTPAPSMAAKPAAAKMSTFKKFADATNGELFDADYKDGEWMVEAVETQETLEQFEESSKGWHERTAMKTGEIGGFPFRAWKSAQAVKGQPRQSISVVDLGGVRIVLPGTDLTIF